MPDPDKLRVLRERNYAVSPCCGLCQHGRFSPGLDWGTCALATYHHAKHGERSLSVHRAGACPAFAFNEKKKADLTRSGFDAFVSPATSERARAGALYLVQSFHAQAVEENDQEMLEALGALVSFFGIDVSELES